MLESLADRISSARKRRGFSQEELAAAAQLNLRTVQRVEKGEHLPRGFTLQRLAAALGLAVEDLTALCPAGPAAPSALPPRLAVGATDPPGQVPPSPVASAALTLLYLSAFSYVLLPGANVVLPLLLWARYRHRPEVVEHGRHLLNFEITWTLFTIGGYGLLLLAQYLLLTRTDWVMIWTPLVFLYGLCALHAGLLLLALWQGRQGRLVLRRLGLPLFT